MKHFFFFSFSLLLCLNIAEAQTYAGLPDSSHVLVVYKLPANDQDTLGIISRNIKNYYQTARGIPAENIVGLNNLTDEWFTYGGTSHRIEIVQSGDILKDTTQAWADRTGPPWIGPSFHVWQYYYERIATPILQRLGTILPNGDTLKNKIRYIVLCKGVPYKLQSRFDHSGANREYPPNHNVSLQSLVSIISNSNYYNLLLSLYSGAQTYNNRYYACDENFTMDYRFVPNFFTNANGVTLSYLVSRLDGLSLDDVKSMIDKAKIADMTGTRTWVLDSYLYIPPQGWPVLLPRPALSEKLRILQFEVNDDFTSDSIWNNDLYNNNLVMGYSSMGKHAGMSPGYIQNSLNFQYAPGAILNTFESFNGNSFGEIKRRDGHGLLAEFIRMGGTGGVCYPWEPGYSNNIVYGEYFFPAYALGYNLVDAIYMDMPNILFQNVVVGDPLCRIATPRSTITLTQNTTLASGDYYDRIIVPEGITLSVQSGDTINFKRNASLIVNGSLIIPGAILNFYGYSNLIFDTANVLITNGTFNFYNNSYLTVQNLSISGNNLAFHDHAQLKAKQLTITPGTHLILNDASSINIQTTLVANGTETNKIFINGNGSSSNINIGDASVLELTNAIIDGIGSFGASAQRSEELHINIDRVEFRNLSSGVNFSGDIQKNYNLKFTNSLITCKPTNAIDVWEIKNVQIENVNISASPFGFVGIVINGCKNTSIVNCNITNFQYGIDCWPSGKSGRISNQPGNLIIQGNNIHMNVSKEFSYGINVTYARDVYVMGNSIYNYDYGISLSQVANPYIADNQIQVLNNRGTAESGIFSNSGKGIYRLNLITGYKKGIELGNSFPLLGQNIITQNTETGLYVSANSFPNLSSGRVKMEAAVREFPLSGLNQIYNNGGLCSYDPFDGSEIYIEDASINLSNGCNTISDDRVQEPNLCNTRILLTALAKGYKDIRAEYNYWGYQPEYGGHNPSERIRSNVQVFFEPFHTEPCVKYPDDKFIVIKNSSGDVVIDTIFSLGEVTLSDSISEAYALASKHFYDGHFTEAKQVYYGIIQTHGLNRKSIEAYTKLYTISKLTDTLASTFTQLKSFYDNKLQSIQDTLMLKIVKHLSDLCLVAKKDYAQAINNFGEVITQNPNSEEAFFAAVDILTTSLLDTGNTTLSKVSGMDLSAKDANDYRTKLTALLKARNNKENILSVKIIPTHYSLYQNYPNPFNPTTKIQYDIPTDTKVRLKIYDILGREVKTLVNEFQIAGRYIVDFNASNLASGVYIYQLSAKGFVKSRKMMVIK